MEVKKIAAIALASACAFSMAAVDFNGHRKPVWYASPRLLRTASGHDPAAHLGGVPRDHSWEGVKVDADHLELIVLNDTNEPYKGSWAVNRVDFDGNVLATQQIDDVELDAASHKGFPLNEEIVDFGDANNELIVAVPSDDSFARVIYNPGRNPHAGARCPGRRVHDQGQAHRRRRGTHRHRERLRA